MQGYSRTNYILEFSMYEQMIRDRSNEIIIDDISKAQVPSYLLFDVRDDKCEH